MSDSAADDEWYSSLARLGILHPNELSFELVEELIEMYPEQKGWINYSYRYLCSYPYSKNPVEAQSYLENLVSDQLTSQKENLNNSLTQDEYLSTTRSKAQVTYFISNQQYSYDNPSQGLTVINSETADISIAYLETYGLEILKRILEWHENGGTVDENFFEKTINEFTNLESFQEKICATLIQLTEPFSDIPIGETIRLLSLQLKAKIDKPFFY